MLCSCWIIFDLRAGEAAGSELVLLYYYGFLFSPFFIPGDSADMWVVGGNPDGVGPGVGGLVDGGGVAAGPLHALHRP